MKLSVANEVFLVSIGFAVVLTAILVGAIFYVGAMSGVAEQPPTKIEERQTTQQETAQAAREIVIYGGELSPSKYGFGLSPDEITSPGPELRINVDELIRIIFKNVGSLPHTWAATNEAKEGAKAIDNFEIGSATKPLLSNEEGSITIKFSKPGEYYYICTVPGHVTLGMWGKIVAE